MLVHLVRKKASSHHWAELRNESLLRSLIWFQWAKRKLLSLKDEKKGSSLFAKASHVCYQAVLRAAKEPLQTTTLLLLLEGVLHCEKRAPPARTMQSQEVVALSKEKEASIELWIALCKKHILYTHASTLSVETTTKDRFHYLHFPMRHPPLLPDAR